MGERTFWNGEPCEARKVSVVVADSGKFPRYWARHLAGERRDAVEVTYNGETFYLDDAAFEVPEEEVERMREALGELSEGYGKRSAGSGWWKVTTGMGSPGYGHSSLQIEPGSVQPRAEETDGS